MKVLNKHMLKGHGARHFSYNVTTRMKVFMAHQGNAPSWWALSFSPWHQQCPEQRVGPRLQLPGITRNKLSSCTCKLGSRLFGEWLRPKCLCISVEPSELLGTFYTKAQPHVFQELRLETNRWAKVKTIWVHMDLISIGNWCKMLCGVLTGLCSQDSKIPRGLVHMWFSYFRIELQQLEGRVWGPRCSCLSTTGLSQFGEKC